MAETLLDYHEVSLTYQGRSDFHQTLRKGLYMPYNELNLSPSGYIILLLILGFLLICLVKSKNTITFVSSKNNKTNNNPEYNSNYGAYIQAQGRYYN